ncbi:anion exchange protein 2-like [Aplochiton taeniatus]
MRCNSKLSKRLTVFWPDTPSASSLRGTEEEDEGDLNKALGVQRFQQILTPDSRVPDEQHRTYNEEDFEYHRHSSHHIHHPLSKLPSDGRRKKSGKKRRKDRERKDSCSPSSAMTIEEGEDEEDEDDESADTHASCSETEGPFKGNVQFFVSDEDPHLAPSVSDSPHFARSLVIIPQSAEGADTDESISSDEAHIVLYWAVSRYQASRQPTGV